MSVALRSVAEDNVDMVPVLVQVLKHGVPDQKHTASVALHILRSGHRGPGSCLDRIEAELLNTNAVSHVLAELQTAPAKEKALLVQAINRSLTGSTYNFIQTITNNGEFEPLLRLLQEGGLRKHRPALSVAALMLDLVADHEDFCVMATGRGLLPWTFKMLQDSSLTLKGAASHLIWEIAHNHAPSRQAILENADYLIRELLTLLQDGKDLHMKMCAAGVLKVVCAHKEACRRIAVEHGGGVLLYDLLANSISEDMASLAALVLWLLSSVDPSLLKKLQRHLKYVFRLQETNAVTEWQFDEGDIMIVEEAVHWARSSLLSNRLDGHFMRSRADASSNGNCITAHAQPWRPNDS